MVVMLDNRILHLLAFISLIGGVLNEYNLTIVHIGDFHSHWFEFNEKEGKCSDQESATGKCFGGFPRLLTMVRDIRKKEKNVIVLSSGEFFLGRSLNPLHGWKIANALVPKLELDAMSLANHDFGSGILELSAFLYAMNFPVVCANMRARETSFLYSRINKSAIIDVNKERIGVVGYVHPETLQRSRNASSVRFFPEIPAIQEEVENLKSKGINKIIALGHSGYYTDLDIAKSVKGVDVVIGGNSDIVLEDTEDENDNAITEGKIHGNYPRVHHHNDTQQLYPNKTLVLHIPQHGKYVGLMRMTFDSEGRVIHESGEPVLLDNSIPQDLETLYYLRNVSLSLEEMHRHSRLPDYDEVLATVWEDLESGKCRMEECALGNLVTDAMLDTYRANQDRKASEGPSEKWGPVDAVVINSGSIRYPLQRGNITVRDLIHSLYVGDFMKRIRMSGKQIRRMMEHSVEMFDPTGVTAPGTFLQVSGLRVTYDLNKTLGNRVRTLSIRCQQCNGTYAVVKPNKNYFVSMPNFMADGGDGYPTYEATDSEDFGQPEILLILEYLTKVNEIIPTLDGRITFLSDDEALDTTEGSSVNNSNTTSLQIPPSSTASMDSRKSILSGYHSDLEKNNSYLALMLGNGSKAAIQPAPVKEEPKLAKTISTDNVLYESVSTNLSENIEHSIQESTTASWKDSLTKSKQTSVVSRNPFESSSRHSVIENKALKNNLTKSVLGVGMVEEMRNSSYVMLTENNHMSDTLENVTNHNFKPKEQYSPITLVNNSNQMNTQAERIIPVNYILQMEKYSPKVEFANDGNSYIVKNNMETIVDKVKKSR